jgi:hypothetical protein
MAGMASSSKQRGASSSKQPGAKPQVIAVRRENALPREGTVSTSRRKPVVKPSIAAPTALLTPATESSNKKAGRVQQTKTSATRTKTVRATGRAANKRGKVAATEIMPAATEEVSAMTPLEAPAIAAPAMVQPEVVVEASAIVEETTIVRAPSAPPAEAVTLPSHRGRRGLATAVWQLLSTLRRWTGIR